MSNHRDFGPSYCLYKVRIFMAVLISKNQLLFYGPCAFVSHCVFAKPYVLAICAMVYEISVKSIKITKNIQFLHCLSEI